MKRRKRGRAPRVRYAVLRPDRPAGERIEVLDVPTAADALARARPDGSVFALPDNTAQVIHLLTLPPAEIARRDAPEAERMLLKHGRPVTAEET